MKKIYCDRCGKEIPAGFKIAPFTIDYCKECYNEVQEFARKKKTSGNQILKDIGGLFKSKVMGNG